jgi:hypothetical protein
MRHLVILNLAAMMGLAGALAGCGKGQQQQQQPGGKPVPQSQPAGGYLDSLSESNRLAQRVASATRMRSLALGLLAYHAQNSEYPPDLKTLADENFVTPDMLLHPGAKGPANRASDYAYIRPAANAPGDLVAIYEPLELNGGEGGNVATVDGACRWMKAADLNAAVERAKKAGQ